MEHKLNEGDRIIINTPQYDGELCVQFDDDEPYVILDAQVGNDITLNFKLPPKNEKIDGLGIFVQHDHPTSFIFNDTKTSKTFKMFMRHK